MKPADMRRLQEMRTAEKLVKDSPPLGPIRPRCEVCHLPRGNTKYNHARCSRIKQTWAKDRRA